MSTYTLGIGGLITAYVVLAAVLLSLHVYSNWSVWIKAFATVLVIGLCVVTYRSYPKLLGWPVATDVLPSRLYLVAVQVSEPDTVYLWAADLDKGLSRRRPRAYELEYSKTLHEQAERAGRKLRRGISVVVEIEPADGAVARVADEAAAVIKSLKLRFVDAPEGLFPKKE